MPEKTALSTFIVKVRHRMRESQLLFAANCGISLKTLSDIELRIANPTLNVMQKIAAYTGTRVAQMLTIEEQTKLCMTERPQYILCSQLVESRKSYGIATVRFEEGELVLLEFIPDISFDVSAMRQFVNLCNDIDLSVLHLTDVVEDFMCR